MISSKHAALCGKHVLVTNQCQEMPPRYTYVTSLNKEPINPHAQQKSFSASNLVTRFQPRVKATSLIGTPRGGTAQNQCAKT